MLISKNNSPGFNRSKVNFKGTITTKIDCSDWAPCFRDIIAEDLKCVPNAKIEHSSEKLFLTVKIETPEETPDKINPTVTLNHVAAALLKKDWEKDWQGIRDMFC